MTFEEAAAMPQAAQLAVQGLRDKGRIQQGQKLLINGAGGGVGTFAIQIAKPYGVEATGVDSSGKLDMLRAMGFDHVLDYAQEDFTKKGRHYDLILDVKTDRSVLDYLRVFEYRWCLCHRRWFHGPAYSSLAAGTVGLDGEYEASTRCSTEAQQGLELHD